MAFPEDFVEAEDATDADFAGCRGVREAREAREPLGRAGALAFNDEDMNDNC